MLGWHFVGDGKRLRYGDNRSVRAGCTYRIKHNRSVALCLCGMHASKCIFDALNYAPYTKKLYCCRVDVRGELVTDSDKFAGRAREVLWLVDATNVLHEFSCRCAEDALALVRKPDARSLRAISVKRAWLRGEASDGQLAAARDAAGDAGPAGPAGAAWAAARAAWNAWAAGGAAWNAWAAGGAARNAARAAAWAHQNRRLTSMIVAAHRNADK